MKTQRAWTRGRYRRVVSGRAAPKVRPKAGGGGEEFRPLPELRGVFANAPKLDFVCPSSPKAAPLFHCCQWCPYQQRGTGRLALAVVAPTRRGARSIARPNPFLILSARAIPKLHFCSAAANTACISIEAPAALKIDDGAVRIHCPTLVLSAPASQSCTFVPLPPILPVSASRHRPDCNTRI